MRAYAGVLLFFLVSSAAAQTPDCNGNGIADSADLQGTATTHTPMGGSFSVGTFQTGKLIDVSSDGKKDLFVVTSGTNGITSVLVRQYGNFFYTSPEATFALQFTPTAIGTGDFDSNAFLDVAFATSSAQANAFNRGDDTFTLAHGQPLASVPPSQFAGGAATQADGDLNGDGRIDRVSVRGDSADIYLRGADNSLVLDGTVSVPFSTCNDQTRTVEILPIADVDGDGDNDVFVLGNETCPSSNGTSYGGHLIFLENNSFATFTQRRTLDHALTFLEYNDVNADGMQDLVFQISRSTLSNTPGGEPRPPQSGIVVYRVSRTVVSKDRNGNTIPDECERAVRGDFGGDRRSDFAVVRSSGTNLLWLVRHSTERTLIEPTLESFGLSEFDIPYAADYDGNGAVEPAVVRDAGTRIPSLYGLYWYNLKPDGTADATQWGLPGDSPFAGHFDADLRADRAVTRSAFGQINWFIRRSTGTEAAVPWGLTGDALYAADRNGDGIDDLIVSRTFLGGVSWFVRSVDGSFTEQVQWGLSGDVPLHPEDADGDGIADFAVARRNGRLWNFFIRMSGGGTRALSFGLRDDTPYLGAFAGEGHAEPAVFRGAAAPFPAESFHFQLTASNVIRVRTWGLLGDRLVRPDGRW